MTNSKIVKIIQQEFLVNKDSKLLGIIFFGSRVKFTKKDLDKNSDFDIGIIFEGKTPIFNLPENWDVFLWSKKKWERGFALQVELAKYAKILYDCESIIQKKFELIQEKILPHWLTHIKKF